MDGPHINSCDVRDPPCSAPPKSGDAAVPCCDPGALEPPGSLRRSLGPHVLRRRRTAAPAGPMLLVSSANKPEYTAHPVKATNRRARRPDVACEFRKKTRIYSTSLEGDEPPRPPARRRRAGRVCGACSRGRDSSDSDDSDSGNAARICDSDSGGAARRCEGEARGAQAVGWEGLWGLEFC